MDAWEVVFPHSIAGTIYWSGRGVDPVRDFAFEWNPGCQDAETERRAFEICGERYLAREENAVLREKARRANAEAAKRRRSNK